MNHGAVPHPVLKAGDSPSVRVREEPARHDDVIIPIPIEPHLLAFCEDADIAVVNVAVKVVQLAHEFEEVLARLVGATNVREREVAGLCLAMLEEDGIERGEAFFHLIDLPLDVDSQSPKFWEVQSDMVDGVRQVGKCLRVRA